MPFLLRNPPRTRLLTGRILSTGHMPSTISALILSPTKTRLHPVLRRPVPRPPRKVMVHDPDGFCVEGDVVQLRSGVYRGLGTGGKNRRGVRFVVEELLVPFAGVDAAERRRRRGGLEKGVEGKEEVEGMKGGT